MQDNPGRAMKAPRREKRSQCPGVMLQTRRRLFQVTAQNQKPSERASSHLLTDRGRPIFQLMLVSEWLLLLKSCLQ